MKDFIGQYKSLFENMGTPLFESNNTPLLNLPQCEHKFDTEHDEPWSDDKIGNLSSDEIQKKWPRRRCNKCGAIVYETFGHMISGDW